MKSKCCSKYGKSLKHNGTFNYSATKETGTLSKAWFFISKQFGRIEIIRAEATAISGGIA